MTMTGSDANDNSRDYEIALKIPKQAYHLVLIASWASGHTSIEDYTRTLLLKDAAHAHANNQAASVDEAVTKVTLAAERSMRALHSLLAIMQAATGNRKTVSDILLEQIAHRYELLAREMTELIEELEEGETTPMSTAKGEGDHDL